MPAAELIAPAEFGFGRPGYMVDTIVRQDGINTVILSGWQSAASIIWKAADKVSLSLCAQVSISGVI